MNKTAKMTTSKQEALQAEYARDAKQLDAEIDQSMLQHATRM